MALDQGAAAAVGRSGQSRDIFEGLPGCYNCILGEKREFENTHSMVRMVRVVPESH